MRNRLIALMVTLALLVNLMPLCPAMAEWEPSLQQILNSAGYSYINTSTDETGIETFQVVRGATYSARLLAEYSAMAAGTSFGWYQVGNPGRRVRIFSGANVPGDTVTFTVPSDVVSIGYYVNPQWYPHLNWYTQSGLNADGFDHARIFKTRTQDEYIIGWEDLFGGGDRDYQDLVVVAITPTRVAPTRVVQASYGHQPNQYGEPVYTPTGNYFYEHQDLSIPSLLDMELTRSYNSRDDYSGPFGVGWTHTYNVNLSLEDDKVVVMREDGRRDYFEKQADGTYKPPLGIFSTLTKNADGTFTLKEKDKTKYNFSSEGKLTSIVDKNGNATNLAYEGDLLKTVTDPFGRSLVFTYDSNGHIIKITDPAGRDFTYSYDGDDNLVSATDPEGNTTTYTYDDEHHLTSYTEPKGNTFITNTYDGEGRVVEQTNAIGERTTFSYDEVNRKTTITDPAGGKTVDFYDEEYRLTKRVDPLGYETIYTYDSYGNRDSITDERGNKTQFIYDEKGNLLETTDRKANKTVFSYDSNDNLTSFTDPLGHVFRMSYDDNSNLALITDPKDAVTQFAYSEKGLLARIIDAKGRATNLSYDECGDLSRITDPQGNTYTYAYDILGNLLSAKDPNGNETRLSYDLRSNLVKITNALNQSVSYAYDPNGNLSQITDAKANTTHYSYDSLNRLSKVIDALGSETSYSYDHLWNLTKVVDANGNATLYSYDAVGNLINTAVPIGNVTTFSYDQNGNRTSQTNALGRITTYEYDENDQLIKITYPDGSTVVFEYDALGRLVKMVDEHGTWTYEYDELGHLVKTTDPKGNAVSYSYDELGLRTSVTYPDGKTVSCTYDEVNRLEKVKDWLNQITSYSYDPAGNLIKAFLPNGVRTTYEYDRANRLLNLTNIGPTGKSKNDKALPSFTYTYDDNGNRVKVVEKDEGKKEDVTEYGYDPLNQLIKVTEENRTRTYTYDKVGNRLSLVETRGKGKEKEITYEYNQANQLLKVTEKDKVTTFSYDENGNMIAQVKSKVDEEQTRTYTYDFQNRLVKVEIIKDGETKIVEYEYDGLGNRISRIETKPDGKKEVTNYINDISDPFTEVLQERDENNSIVQSYVHGLDLVSKINEKNKANYYLYDGLGSVVGLTNQQGALTARYSYDEFGVPDPESKFDNHAHHGNVYGFTGEDYDQVTGLLYLRARYYMPEVGRFVTEDPFQGFISFPRTLHHYLYVGNNPLTYVDPSGLRYFDINVSLGKVVGITVGIHITKGGFRLYGGAGIMWPPPGGASITYSPHTTARGWAGGLQFGYWLGTQFGWMFTPRGGFFWEGGLVSPGISFTGFYIGPKVTWEEARQVIKRVFLKILVTPRPVFLY